MKGPVVLGPRFIRIRSLLGLKGVAMDNLATVKGFHGDPYKFRKAAHEAAKNITSFRDPSPVPEVKTLGEWLFGTENFKGVLVFIPSIFREVDIRYSKRVSSDSELYLIKKFVDQLIDELLVKNIIDEAELDF